ncbi:MULTISPECIES: rhomboid family intramembrane serine protease [unclassified Lysobacter]|uniref:rhomboid family intramembrane serine protease n=1 Tax=unclassified Lysobacter TaxID=2635362 RepID=UPI001BECF969|nr:MULTISPECIES: rhomboid family intramembrane serine protease [unclassified Lysobacter]MBT2748787.1 rhomboid family intramembrane serine protease [Lysobacter sp. ISL-42]MBT2754331.1 rhomboid family intramembrane serine protease [Lysobacter sp. ISL-50]MBT2779887.1 rhomboid family intramembrane serine protease [Lysobacter sp. ISL-54]MBT2783049.1 rhomboid family intramembrane serine protease [Lysobacter sp. ISL-52]
MLILPLHRPFTRANFPFVTILLALANVFVFLALQSGDRAGLEKLRQYYLDSGLGRIEAPAYEQHLRNTGQADASAAFAAAGERERLAYVGVHTLTDVTFAQALRGGALFPDAGTLEQWRPLRARYEAMQDEVFTLRHIMRSSEIDPWRMLSAAFLHGDAMHLIGNMVFLLALGLLVEGAVGPLLFVVLYVLGAYGSSAASLWWRWGEAGGGLGASGAIAALMGAFCLVWGLRPVRFFYWIGVIFDYVRAPAILLLPLWLGWELYNLFANQNLGIGFDAHAGGLITGALIGAVFVALGRVREAFVSDYADAAAPDTRWEQAQQHLGRMQLAEADRLLEELLREQPQRFELQLARYRVARNGGRRDVLDQRRRELLAASADTVEGAQAQAEALAAIEQAGDGIDSAQRQSLARCWIGLGALDTVEAMLDRPVSRQWPEETQAQLWFELSLGYRDRQARPQQARVLRALVERHPRQPQADKARFLLEHELAAPG